jgi:RecA-family ATPase
VVYLAAEDPEPVLVRRIHALGKHLPPQAREAIAAKLAIEPIMGKRLNVMAESHLRRVIDYATDARLIVLDTLSRIHQLDENSNGDMSHLMSMLEHIADRTGAAVLYLHHTNKVSALQGQGDLQQAARGASALVDNARWCGYVARMTEDEAKHLSTGTHGRPIGGEQRGYFLRFGVSKHNYAEPMPEQWYERRDGGVLLPIELLPAQNGKGGKREEA